MTLNKKRSSTYQTGFTLVEIMVGLAIGMLATLVIIQVMSVFEAQKRATTGTADAQTNGGIALYNIGRELQFAGYPLMPTGVAGAPDSPLECVTTTFGATGITSITPAVITDGVVVAGVSSASDTVTIHYGNSLAGGIPSKIGAAPVGSVVTVGSNFGCQVGDVSLIVNGATCAISTVTALSAVGTTPSTVTLQNTTAAVNGADLSCMGAWNTVTYAVNNGNLERNGVATVAGIVNLQAQYGISTSANSNQVTQWVDASGSTWSAPTVANRNRIKAIRIAVVARNPKIELSAITNACSSTTSTTPTGLCAWAGVAVGGAISVASPAPVLSLSDGDADWARYRYRVYETIIPLRNTIWSKGTL